MYFMDLNLMQYVLKKQFWNETIKMANSENHYRQEHSFLKKNPIN